ncbi:hypothetical protein Avbf_04477 [Armadillidium vulgare]|nr:hypothetical protein Avbf_04477 [Armadillidium vulgare]
MCFSSNFQCPDDDHSNDRNYLYYGTITCNMPRHYEKKEGTRRIMYRQDYIARAMIDVQDVDPCRCRYRCSRCRCRLM